MENQNKPLVSLNIMPYKQRSFVIDGFPERTIYVTDEYIDNFAEITKKQLEIAKKWQEDVKNNKDVYSVREVVQKAKEVFDDVFDTIFWFGAFDDIYEKIKSISTMFNIFVQSVKIINTTIEVYKADDDEILNEFIKANEKQEKEAKTLSDKLAKDFKIG